MSFLSRFFGMSRSTVTVVFDVGGASVGGAIVGRRKDGELELLHTVRVPILLKKSSEGRAPAEALAAACEKAGRSVLAAFRDIAGHRGEFSVHVVIHPPWCTSHSKQAAAALPEPSEVTKELLKAFVARRLPYENEEGLVQFDQHVARVELNGYSTGEPYGQIAEHIGVTMLVNSMSEDVHAALTRTLGELFPNVQPVLHAFVLIAVRMPELFEHRNTLTLVDVGRESTSITVVRDDAVAGMAHLAFGTEHLVRAIAGEQDESAEAARSLLVMYLTNTCTPSQCRKVEDALKSAEREWTKQFADACAQLAVEHKMPALAFILVDERVSAWFQKALGKLDFAHSTVTARPFEAVVIDMRHLPRTVRTASKVKRDTMLAVAALFTADK
ncbi:MAG: hypothetical protein Q8P16_01515 [bacterium]|nr:hypothetical protein [bacterium]